MAVFILIECPNCHRRLSVSSKVCQTKKGKGCGLNLDKAKKSKDGVFYWIAYRLEKKLVWERFKTREDAEAHKVDREDGINKKKYKTKEDLIPKQPEPKKQDTMTFKKLSDQYLSEGYVKAKKSYFQKANSLKNFNRVFGDRIVSSITAADLKNYQAIREEKDRMAKSTIDQETGEAQTVIQYGYDNDLVDESVKKRFEAVKDLLKRGSNRRTVTIDQDQYEAILQRLPHRSTDPFVLLRWTGMREGEVLNLVWERVLPLEERMIKLEAAETKDGEDRGIPMTGEVLLCLKERYKEGNKGRIFSVNKDQLIDDVRKACQEAGVPYGRYLKNGFTIHSLRHTFNTEMYEAGVPQWMIQQFTGHSSDEMSKRYLHVKRQMKVRAIEHFEDFVRNGQSVNQSVNKTPISGQEMGQGANQYVR